MAWWNTVVIDDRKDIAGPISPASQATRGHPPQSLHPSEMRMGWKAVARRAYEERVVKDALDRLAGRVDLRGLPFSEEELKTLARRARESFLNSQKRGRYKVHLAKLHGPDWVATVSAALEKINNEIGYEEK